MLEDGPTTCERCGGELRRVFHPTGIIFKGGGFYKTDSRSSSSGSVTGGSRPAASGSGDGSAPSPGSSESKTSDAGSGATSKPPASGAAKGDGGGD